jgi:hypothetical protein
MNVVRIIHCGIAQNVVAGYRRAVAPKELQRFYRVEWERVLPDMPIGDKLMKIAGKRRLQHRRSPPRIEHR